MLRYYSSLAVNIHGVLSLKGCIHTGSETIEEVKSFLSIFCSVNLGEILGEESQQCSSLISAAGFFPLERKTRGKMLWMSLFVITLCVPLPPVWV